MRYPGFIAEMGLPHNRDKLEFGVFSGYGLTALFAILALVGPALELVPQRSEFWILVVLKLCANTLAWLGLRTNRGALELGGLNVLADVVCMTGAIHFTGGVLSPLLAVYAIEITVIALLTNFGVTVMVGSLIAAAYALSTLGTYFGLFAPIPPPRAMTEGVTLEYLATALSFTAFVIAVPTFIVARMVGKLRQNERALAERNAELVEAGRQKSQFLANVTHELRTPIHGICGLSDLVESGVYGAVTERQRQAHEDIKRSARSLLALIDDLLELVRGDAGKLELNATQVNARELLDGALASMRWVKGTRELELVLDASADLPPLTTDRAKLTQIVVNLLANAIKFTPDGGTITLGARSEGNALEISVSDTGRGMAPDEIPNIFQAFRQIDGSAEREYGGVGLGLAVVERLASVIGAELSVESELGKGSTFRVRVPVARVSAVHAA